VNAQCPNFPQVKGSLDINPSETMPQFEFKSSTDSKNKYFSDVAGISKIDAITEYDQWLNPAGTKYDLGRDGAFSDFSVLIGKFYNGEGFTNENFTSGPGADLTRKGFKWKIVTTEVEFISELNKYDIAWIISRDSVQQEANFVKAVKDFYNAGNGLFIWADNTPWEKHANALLPALLGTNIVLSGCDHGTKELTLGNTGCETGKFKANHSITTGVEHLYEGITICYPNTNGPLKVLATSSHGHPVSLYLEKQNGKGNLLVDCGFTKLYVNFNTAGTGRYISNATCWLTGLTDD